MGLIIFFFILDKVDGYIARRYNQVTELGKALDGFADTFGLFIIMAYFYLFSILSAVELFIIILPRLIYYGLTYFIRLKYGEFIQTYLWKINLIVWLVLFTVLFFTGHNLGIIIPSNIVLYGITTWHFVVVFRKLYFKTESKMIAK
jgi:phosphatidylglycerophosphate synthase